MSLNRGIGNLRFLFEIRRVVDLLCNFASSANHDISFSLPPKQLHGLTEWHPEGHLLTKHYRWTAAANNTQSLALWGMLSWWKKKCLESAHVSWILNQRGGGKSPFVDRGGCYEGREESTFSNSQETKRTCQCAERRWDWQEAMSTQSQQGPLFVQVRLGACWLPEPRHLYTFLQADLHENQSVQHINRVKQYLSVKRYYFIKSNQTKHIDSLNEFGATHRGKNYLKVAPFKAAE